MTDVSPLMIQTVLAHHVSPEPQANTLPALWAAAPAVEARAWLEANDYLRGGKATAKLHAWAKAICETPQPRVCFEFPERGGYMIDAEDVQ